MAPSHLHGSAQNCGQAAKKTAELKWRKYRLLADVYDFVPVCIETYGACDVEGVDLINKIGSKLKEVTAEIRSATFLWQSIMMAVQRGNAISVLGTILHSDDSKLEEIFYFS